MSSSTGSAALRVLVVDQNELFRLGVAALLNTVGDVEASSAATTSVATELASAAPFDVALVDVALGAVSGIALCEQIKAEHPGVKVVMLTDRDTGTDLYAALQAGASGYLLKSSSFKEISEALRAVVRGQSMISPAMAATMLEDLKQSEAPESALTSRRRLSERELDVLRLVARGMNNRDVGKALSISEFTVKNHMRSILDKLALQSRTEAAMYAVRENLVDL